MRRAGDEPGRRTSELRVAHSPLRLIAHSPLPPSPHRPFSPPPVPPTRVSRPRLPSPPTLAHLRKFICSHGWLCFRIQARVLPLHAAQILRSEDLFAEIKKTQTNFRSCYNARYEMPKVLQPPPTGGVH